MADVAAEVMERNDLKSDDIAWLVPHQANKRIIDATANRTGVTADKVIINIVNVTAQHNLMARFHYVLMGSGKVNLKKATI